MTPFTFLLILALVCFLIDALRGLPATINWTALGLALVTIAVLISRGLS